MLVKQILLMLIIIFLNLETRDLKKGKDNHYPYIVDGAGRGMIDDLCDFELKNIIEDIDIKGIMSGSNALFYSIIKEVQNNPDFLNIDYLYNSTKEELKKVFNAVSGEISLFNERYNNFKETVTFIHDNNSFYNYLYSFKSDIQLEQYIINNLSSFDDKSEYKNHIIHFNKRANLLVNDLYHISKTIRENIGNVNNLTGCADYGIPRTLRDYGILEYAHKLQELIDNEKEILHDSEMEIEIRANMLYVIELIKEGLKKKNIYINSVELDNIIWLMGKKNQDRKSISHHTITIFY